MSNSDWEELSTELAKNERLTSRIKNLLDFDPCLMLDTIAALSEKVDKLSKEYSHSCQCQPQELKWSTDSEKKSMELAAEKISKTLMEDKAWMGDLDEQIADVIAESVRESCASLIGKEIEHISLEDDLRETLAEKIQDELDYVDVEKALKDELEEHTTTIINNSFLKMNIKEIEDMVKDALLEELKQEYVPKIDIKEIETLIKESLIETLKREYEVTLSVSLVKLNQQS